jgi:hypothetical protein
LFSYRPGTTGLSNIVVRIPDPCDSSARYYVAQEIFANEAAVGGTCAPLNNPLSVNVTEDGSSDIPAAVIWGNSHRFSFAMQFGTNCAGSFPTTVALTPSSRALFDSGFEETYHPDTGTLNVNGVIALSSSPFILNTLATASGGSQVVSVYPFPGGILSSVISAPSAIFTTDSAIPVGLNPLPPGTATTWSFTLNGVTNSSTTPSNSFTGIATAGPYSLCASAARGSTTISLGCKPVTVYLPPSTH